MSKWKITNNTNTRKHGHGDFAPETIISQGNDSLINITVSGYYATREQVDLAAKELCDLLNLVGKCREHSISESANNG